MDPDYESKLNDILRKGFTVEELENGYVPNKDFKVFTIKDVFTQDHINELIHHYRRFEHYYETVGYAGQRKWGLNYRGIAQRLEEVVSENLGEEVTTNNVELCIYTQDFGYKPKLYPHWDHHVTDGQRVTMSVQIDSNVDWDIFVEGNRYKCNKNEGLVFSGTQQVHWRDKIDFKPGDYSASVFAHFVYKNNKLMEKNHHEIMTYWEDKYQKQTGIPLWPEPLDPNACAWTLRDEWIETSKRLFP